MSHAKRKIEERLGHNTIRKVLGVSRSNYSWIKQGEKFQAKHYVALQKTCEAAGFVCDLAAFNMLPPPSPKELFSFIPPRPDTDHHE